MALDLTDEELETAAMACRAVAYQEGALAKQVDADDMRAPIEDTAKRFAALAEKFEATRKTRFGVNL
jgi:hypothetical protein